MGQLDEQLADGLIAQAVDLDRASEGLSSDVLKDLNKMDTALAQAVRDSEIDQVQRTFYRQKRGEGVINDSRQIIDNGVAAARKTAESELLDFAQEAQAGFLNELDKLFTVRIKFSRLSNATLRSTVTDTLVQGATQDQWWTKLAADAQLSFSMGVRQAALTRKAGESIVASAVGKRTAKIQSGGDTYYQHSGGNMDRLKSNVDTLVKTLTASIVEAVRQALIQANWRYFAGQQAIATLDNRTSQLCRGRDHMAWDSEGKPIESTGADFEFPGPPPFHFRCRTFMAPILKNFNQLKRIIPRLPNKYAAVLDGVASRKQTYAQWFAKQPQTTQRKILGAGKFDVYTTGKLSLQDMLNNKGNPLRVGQLQYKAARKGK